MIPIHRDNGAIVAFGGRAMDAGQQPKYLNSPETAIYVKGRTLYGLNLGKQAIRRLKYAVLVEGYFDWAQAYQAGITNVVASSGTALTPAQARLLRRFAGKVILSFDPDAAGQGAAARSSEMLVTEGFQVNVAMLPAGDDPDNYIRRHGAAAYQEQLRNSRQYLEYLLDRSAAEADLSTDEGRRSFLGKMLAVAARIPDAAQRDQFADRLSHKARITEEVVRAEIRKAAVQRQTNVARGRAARPGRRPGERRRTWPDLGPDAPARRRAWRRCSSWRTADLDGLATRGILRQAQSLQGLPAGALPDALIERLSTAEAAAGQGNCPPEGCTRPGRRVRPDVEKATVRQGTRPITAGNRPAAGAGHRHTTASS